MINSLFSLSHLNLDLSFDVISILKCHKCHYLTYKKDWSFVGLTLSVSEGSHLTPFYLIKHDVNIHRRSESKKRTLKNESEK